MGVILSKIKNNILQYITIRRLPLGVHPQIQSIGITGLQLSVGVHSQSFASVLNNTNITHNIVEENNYTSKSLFSYDSLHG